MSEHSRLALSELHLAAEAIVAYLDGELASGPEQRATHHLEHCSECRTVLAAQRQAKSTLGRACTPPPAQDLLAKLRNIPVDTPLPGPGGPDMTLAMEGDQIVWRKQSADRDSDTPKSSRRRSARAEPAPPGPVSLRHTPRFRTVSRGLLGAAAAVMVGMLAVTTPSPANGSGPNEPQPRTADPNVQDTSVETTDVVTASVPHGFGDEPLQLDPHPGAAFLFSSARP